MLQKNTKEEFLKYAENAAVACIGAGDLAMSFIEGFRTRRITFFDNDVKKHGKLHKCGMSLEVYPVESIVQFARESVRDVNNFVIVIAAKAYSVLYRQIRTLGMDRYPIFIYPFIRSRDEMFQQTVRQCLSDYYYHNHFDLSKREEFINHELGEFPKDAVIIPYLPVYLTTRCTLNCQKCNNLMPYLRNSSKDYEAELIQKSLSIILSKIHEMTFCELVGGEPFLYDDLEKILDFVGNQKKIRQIIVVTNGTIIPNEGIMQRLERYHVLVRISDYGLFEKMSRLVAELEKRNINVRILQNMKWNDPGGIDKRNRTAEELFFQYNKCIFSLRCKYLAGDKLFTCARIASLYLLGKQINEEDVLLISDVITADELQGFYMNDFGYGCDYCDLCSIDGGDEIPAAIQMDGREMKRSQYTIIRNDYFERLKGK